MNFILKPSLQHIAIVKIVTSLVTQDDINSIIQDEYFRWDEAEKKLIKKVKTMTMPKLLEQKVLGAIKPIYDEINVWKKYHILFGYFDDYAFLQVHKIFWTSHGTVNKRKTAEMYIRNKEINAQTRFRLACMYCLDNDIPALWDQIPANVKLLFATHAQVFKLVMPWNTSYAPPFGKSEFEQYESECLHAAVKRNVVAVKYFWDKLEPEQRENVLVNTKSVFMDPNWCNYNEWYLGETLCFLFSQMTDEQQREMLEIRPYDILKSLLEWPRQDLFLETLKRMWYVLPVYDYRLLLFIIILGKLKMGYTDYNYREVFMECWQRSPLTHKKFVFNDHTGLCLLFSLFQTRDKNCIEWVLKDATTEEKGNLICTRTKRMCKELVDSEEWDLVEIFMRECISSEDEMTNPKICKSPAVIIH